MTPNTTIIAMRDAGATFGQIAKATGMTRSAVAGALWRRQSPIYASRRKPRPCGEATHAAKLTNQQIRAIRAEYVKGSRADGLVALAGRYGVAYSTVRAIVTRATWAHVE